MRVKGITGEFERGHVYVSDTSGGREAGTIFTSKELETMVTKDSIVKQALTSGITADVNLVKDKLTEGVIFVREDHPLFNIDLIADEFEADNSEEITMNVLAASVWLSVWKYLK
jgi:hypothetical protein